MSAFGLKRCHFVTAEGVEQQLIPDPGSAEGHRAKFEQAHPALSRGTAGLSLIILIIGLIIGLMMVVPQVIAPLSQLPPVAEYIGTLTSPIDLPTGLNTAVGILIGIASIERALRLRYNRFLDGGAG